MRQGRLSHGSKLLKHIDQLQTSDLIHRRRKKLLFDDLDLMYSYMGPAVYYPNQNIRRMLDFARVKKTDTFYDLGSGYGQNLVVAITEFNAKRAVGFETDKQRLHILKERLKKVCSPDVGKYSTRIFLTV
jgi:SAM-dependent methyltransferase